jgi:hypothetical protein
MLSGRRRTDDESGFVLVLVALTMVVSLVFVAFAVDLGAGVSERRQDQTAADAAVLAGVQAYPDGLVGAATTAMAQARKNIRQPFTDAQWKAMWVGCVDANKPADYTVTGTPLDLTDPSGTTTITTGCITFNTSRTRMRVRLPNMAVKTNFAGVIGVQQLSTSAVAEAEISGTGVLPFGLLASAASQSESCLKATSNGHDLTQPCNGSDDGNFGSLDSPLYGNPQFGTTTKCSGDTNGRLVTNMIKGIDHQLDEYREAGEAGEAIRNDACFVSRPNQVWTQTGIGNNLDIGLMRGTAGDGPPRLQRTPYQTRNVTGVDVDDKPLWEFIPTGLIAGADTATMVPATCTRESFVGADRSKTHLAQCLADYRAGSYTTPLFTADDTDPGDGTYDIELAPRFAFVPLFWENAWGTGTETHLIKAFRAVYIQTLFFGCNGNTCQVTWNPGEGGNGPLGNNEKVESMTAMLLPDSTLPQSIIENGPGGRLRAGRLIK